MFEFDEHYLELDLLESQPQSFIIEDDTELTPQWLYVGYEVYKLAWAAVPQERRDQLAS
jgi:hypothetical protein